MNCGTALERARLADVVADMPDGLDTVVGERGYRLSGGQRQRLTIARLLLGTSRVVVLDEATASLDSESEAAVQQALAEALQGRTSIVIAHRLSTVRAADLILVVEDGRIVERGTHSQLLAKRGRYAELYETQFGDQERAAHDPTLTDRLSVLPDMGRQDLMVEPAARTGLAVGRPPSRAPPRRQRGRSRTSCGCCRT